MKTLNRFKYQTFSMLAVAAMGLYMTSCSTSSTAITGSWSNEMIESADYNHIIVAPMIANKRITSNLEDEIAMSLKKNEVEVEKGSNLLPQKYVASKVDKKKVFQSLEDRKIDAILTVSLVDQEAEARYVMGNPAYTPVASYPYYQTYWGYYDNMYPNVYREGYYVVDQQYYIETNLYDAKTEKLIWSAQTKTHDPVTIESFTDDFSDKIVDQLKEDDII